MMISMWQSCEPSVATDTIENKAWQTFAMLGQSNTHSVGRFTHRMVLKNNHYL